MEYINNNKKYKDSGPEASGVQKLLSLLGYDLILDGKFQRITLRSVKAFQKRVGLKQDGIVGQKTLTALKASQKKSLKETSNSLDIDYLDLNVIRDCVLPDSQYIKQITSKKQIFIHFTAGGPIAKNTISYWNSNAEMVSTAFVIDGNDGYIYESFNPDYWSFHLGVKGTNGKLDKTSIGIEICSYGPLVKKGNDYFAWPNDWNTKVNPNSVYALDESFRGYSYFQKYTDKQLENLEKLLIFLIKKYNIPIQNNFDKTWFGYMPELVVNCTPGIYTHVNVRKDKSDSYPDDRLIELLNRISKNINA